MKRVNNHGKYDTRSSISFNFAKEDILPSTATVQFLNLKHPTDFRSYDGVSVFLVQSGRGTLMINNYPHELKAGSCFFLHFFLFFKFIPDPETGLELCECFAPSVNYHFALNIPGSPLQSFEVTEGFLEMNLSSELYAHTLSALEHMYSCSNLVLQNIYFYKLLGYLERARKEALTNGRTDVQPPME